MFYAFTYGSAGWLGLQALPLIATPKVIVTMLASEVHRSTGMLAWLKLYSSLRAQTPAELELYFSRSLGFSLVILALIVLFFTGTIPLSSTISEPVSLEDNDPKAPYAVHIVRVMTLWHLISLIYCYMRYVNTGQFGFVLGALGYGSMTALGLWIVVFGTTAARLSKRTGADKRTAGFPFKNEAAYNKKKDRKMI